MRGLCYFFLLTQVHSSTISVTGFIGHNVTLPCSYDTHTHGVLSFCWGRDKVPWFKCSNTILSSQDGAVQFRSSSRYQLLGETEGDVSLTILNAQWSDAGVYGCRIEIPGLLNDYKVNTHLIMEEEISTTNTPKDLEISDPTSAISGMVIYEEKPKTLLGVGDTGRVAAISFSTVIIILFFIFRRRFWPESTRQHLHTSTAENIYEIVPVPE